jgi:superfamily II DNA or RNA helicase
VKTSELVPGQKVIGLSSKGPIEIIQVSSFTDGVASIVAREADGSLTEIIASDEMKFSLVDFEAFSFSGEPNGFKLAMEAKRMSLAGIFDPFVAVSSSNLQVLPHQLSAVYGELLERVPLRFLLADEPGAGKTIMAGLLIKELMLRGLLKKCLIIAPGSLCDQWEQELREKFCLSFRQITRDSIVNAENINLFDGTKYLIGRMDQLSRSQGALQHRLKETNWDLVIVDEAHRMSAQQFGFGGETRRTRRFQLGQLISGQTTHLLLMTATPHSGSQENFHLFLSLLDQDLFEGNFKRGQVSADLSTVMLRRVKEDLVDLEGKTLFPKRRAKSIAYDLSKAELELYEAVTNYVREEMSRALANFSGNKKISGNITFALMVLQRRLASSPLAILNSLRRRLEKLQQSRTSELVNSSWVEDSENLFDDIQEFSDLEIEELEESANLIGLTASGTSAELAREVTHLENLIKLAESVNSLKLDSKWLQLKSIFESDEFATPSEGEAEKLIVFTEHRDTLEYLERRISDVLSDTDQIISIHGGLSRKERLKAQTEFTNNPNCKVLIATDAAGEGINLQRAHLMVNYDLPWNPNRIEQRFGRIHRIGQKRVCTLWNLVAANTREGAVYLRLLEKIKAQGDAYDGSIFHVLGGDAMFSGQSLSDLLIEAVTSESSTQDPIIQKVDAAVSSSASQAAAEKALLPEIASKLDSKEISDAINESKARRLSPGFVAEFFKQAYKDLGGTYQEKESERLRLPNVPAAILREAQMALGGFDLASQYERIAFRPEETMISGAPDAELLAPGSPLLSATVNAIFSKYPKVLDEGTVFVEDSSGAEELPYLIVCLSQDFVNAQDQTHSLSKIVRFAKVTIDGDISFSDVPPYFDFSAPSFESAKKIREQFSQQVEVKDLINKVSQSFLNENLARHLPALEMKAKDRIELLEREIIKRLDQETTFWNNEAIAIAQGTKSSANLSAENAKSRANDLELRKLSRLEELGREKTILPRPVQVLSVALVAAQSLVSSGKDQKLFSQDQFAREAVERRAVEKTLTVEKSLKFDAKELPRNNKGYDLESFRPSVGKIFIEVKGRIEGATEFFVTESEFRFGLTQGEAFILSLVKVSPDGDAEKDEIRYIVDPFRGSATQEGHEARVLNFDHYWSKGRDPLGNG